MSCPICKNDSAARYRPFCSKRCADIDLGRWMRGSYAIPADEPPADADAQEADIRPRETRH
ncbi:DNA gyrase inhibitor YacG [Oceanomicrobium pacificus]|uniref:DNA gyrase inhibitor YacG n=1 Tax=Oceanomicrobium pacificus TaxID=2692916 RepID=A0A6B0TZY5_9RHOB|nr:DNA gyrase inhibitor YacG [Oceanomicrobium pacificus]MXU66544.1 DNA gyrase inhibitor YacG [Oceanomicrobium pacificus]